MKVDIAEERERLNTNNFIEVLMSKGEVVDRTGPSGGPAVLKLKVENDEGLVAVFWMNVRFKNGRPSVSVSTSPSGEKVVTKSVTGTCFKL